MNCFYHTSVEAIGICKSCAKGICVECATDTGHGLACKGRCEPQVIRIASLAERNFKHQTTVMRLRLIAPVLLLFLGSVFLFEGLAEKNVPNFVSTIGGAFLLFGVIDLLLMIRNGKRLKAG